jgi:hypothetical protein|tara:strand:+ start:1201 stop:1527 length:327 start_codon:yes stop_codon:yes gene_type:complete
MSYLKIPLTPAVNGQTSVVIQKKDIASILAVAGGLSTIINVNTSVGAEDILTLTHTAAAAGFNVADILQDAWTSNPGGIVATVGGIPAVVSATGQATSFVQFSAAIFS